MIKVTVMGFETIEQAYEWAKWYCESGEQSWFIWDECIQEEGMAPFWGGTETIQKGSEEIILNLRK